MEVSPGAYDAVVTHALAEALDGSELAAALEDVDSAEAADRYSRLVADVVARAVASLPSSSRVERGAELTNHLIGELGKVLSSSMSCLLYTSDAADE